MITVAWDVDDVLNDLMWAWFHQEWVPAHPECPLHYADIRRNPPHEVLGISISDYLSSIDAFRISEKAGRLRPRLEVIDWLQSQGSSCLNVAVTARPTDSLPEMSHWLFRHFGSHIRALGIVPVRLKAGEPVHHRSKGEFLRWFGKIDVLVDDSQENIDSAESSGVRGILFPQPWNSGNKTVQDTLHLLSEMVRNLSCNAG